MVREYGRQGTFGAQRTIVTQENGAYSLFFSDVDTDGDIDLLANGESSYFGGVSWYENRDGKGKFGNPITITTSAGGSLSVCSADIDGDSDTDVLSAFWLDGRIAWYEQRLVGDSNGDGVFNSEDLVHVFTQGKYEDSVDNNATFNDGDWNQDGDFTTADLVLAFQAGNYETGNAPLASEMAAAVNWPFAHDDDAGKSQVFVT